MSPQVVILLVLVAFLAGSCAEATIRRAQQNRGDWWTRAVTAERAARQWRREALAREAQARRIGSAARYWHDRAVGDEAVLAALGEAAVEDQTEP